MSQRVICIVTHTLSFYVHFNKKTYEGLNWKCFEIPGLNWNQNNPYCRDHCIIYRHAQTYRHMCMYIYILSRYIFMYIHSCITHSFMHTYTIFKVSGVLLIWCHWIWILKSSFIFVITMSLLTCGFDFNFQ